MLILLSVILVMAAFFPMKLVATSVKKAVLVDGNNSSPIQFAGKVNVSALDYNSTRLTNASSITPQEIHKPLSPKSPQEIQTEKEQIQKSKSNISVFTQELPGRN